MFLALHLVGEDDDWKKEDVVKYAVVVILATAATKCPLAANNKVPFVLPFVWNRWHTYSSSPLLLTHKYTAGEISTFQKVGVIRARYVFVGSPFTTKSNSSADVGHYISPDLAGTDRGHSKTIDSHHRTMTSVP